MSDHVFKRRMLLRDWIRERDAHQYLTASEIADVSGIYGEFIFGLADRCFDDLKALDRAGMVTRMPGRPARWTA